MYLQSIVRFERRHLIICPILIETHTRIYKRNVSL
jgi:hypothetical protein